MKKALSLLVFSMLLIFCKVGHSQTSSEYLMKAAFIERFTRFTTWPNSNGFSDNSRPFIISVLGDNPFDGVLIRVFLDHKVKNKNVELRYLSDINQIKDCSILFITSKMSPKISQIIRKTQNKPILTISDTPGFCEAGVLVNFFLLNNKLRFEVNQTKASNSTLKLSHLILQHAKIIEPKQK